MLKLLLLLLLVCGDCSNSIAKDEEQEWENKYCTVFILGAQIKRKSQNESETERSGEEWNRGG